MREFGLSVTANLDAGPLSSASCVTPNSQVAKITTFEALYEARMKEHSSHIEHTKRLNAGDYSHFAGLPTFPPAGLGVGGGLASQSAFKPESKVPADSGTTTAYCERCNGKTNHKIHSQLKERESFGDYDEFATESAWQVLRCLGCNETRFRHHVLKSEFYIVEAPPDYKEESSVEVIYPTPQKRKPKEYANAPDVIRSLYCQTLQALNGSMPHLCAGGMRAILDAVCSDRGINEGLVLDEESPSLSPKLRKGKEYRSENLEGKIWGLAEADLVTVKDAAVLHKHRFLGNDALHKALAPTDDSLENAMDVIEHVLEKIYELPRKAAGIERAKP